MKALLPKVCQCTQLSIRRMGSTDLILGFSGIYGGKTMRCLFNSKNQLSETQLLDFLCMYKISSAGPKENILKEGQARLGKHFF